MCPARLILSLDAEFMMQPQLKSEDRIVPLAGLARTSSIVAGAVNGAVLTWIAGRGLLFSGEALLGGALLGFVLGTIAGQILFPAPGGQVVVVKVGRPSLPVTLKAAIAGALLVSIAVAMIIKTVIAPAMPTSLVWGIALAVGSATGITWGTLASLL